MNKIVIQLICPDQTGIIAQLTTILYNFNVNVLSIEQHVDKEESKFYIRLLIDLKQLSTTEVILKNTIQELNKTLNGKFKFYNQELKNNIAICSISGDEYKLKNNIVTKT